jgi:aspartate carbamoyltransferase catalytic subunit
MLKNAKPNLKIFHPLPRLSEIDEEIDKTPFPYFFEQAANGIFVRQAIMATMLKRFL